jgi:hypothetical protein
MMGRELTLFSIKFFQNPKNEKNLPNRDRSKGRAKTKVEAGASRRRLINVNPMVFSLQRMIRFICKMTLGFDVLGAQEGPNTVSVQNGGLHPSLHPPLLKISANDEQAIFLSVYDGGTSGGNLVVDDWCSFLCLKQYKCP